MSASDTGSDEIRFERRGALGLVTLDRPRALNALSLPMIRALHARLDAWAEDPGVRRIALRGSARAFCAGGDIRHIHACGTAGRWDDVFAFWQAEYGLIARIGTYPKPVVSLIAGVVMGAGVGLSLHGAARVAAESYQFAMPEVGIGLFPDVGMTHALPRLPGHTGTYLALTGARIGPGDARALGLATHAAPETAFAAILDALADGEPLEAALGVPGFAPPPGPVAEARALIDRCFEAPDVAEILARLEAEADPFAREAAVLMRGRSPTSLCIALAQMRRGPGLSLPEAIRAEYRLVTRVMAGHDFFEGVRAVLVDKDNRPAWQPADLAAVDRAAVEAAFGPTGRPEPDFG